MAADSEADDTGEGASVADSNALQLGTRRRHLALVPRSRQPKRSALFGGLRLGRGDTRAAWLSAFAFGYRIPGPARSRYLRVSEERFMGIDCALTRHWFAWTQARISQSAATGLELLRSLHRHDGANQRLFTDQPL